MASQKKFDLEKYVKYDVEGKKSMCLVENCEKELSEKRPANKKRHYKLVHKKNIGVERIPST